MTRHDERVVLRQMLDHAREARDMAAGRSQTDLDTDRQLELSLIRLLEIVGEAATRASPEFRIENPGLPWQEIMDFRNRLIHGYDSVDLDICWQVIRDDLSPLIATLERLIPLDET